MSDDQYADGEAMSHQSVNSADTDGRRRGMRKRLKAALAAGGIALVAALPAAGIRFSREISRAWSNTQSGKQLVTTAEAADQINATAPIMVDEETELMNAMGLGGMLVYNYRLVNLSQQDTSRQQIIRFMMEEIKPSAVSQGCTTPEMRQWFDRGVTWRYMYHYADRTYIGQFDIKLADCTGRP